MTTMQLNEALDVALRVLADIEQGGSQRLAITHAVRHEAGWALYYNSAAYLETGNFIDLLGGNAPIVVRDDAGSILVPVTDDVTRYIGPSISFPTPDAP